MKKITQSKMQTLQGGLCIDRPGVGQENSGIYCPGYCLATQIVVEVGGAGFEFYCLA